jgi:hypothetical protein
VVVVPVAGAVREQEGVTMASESETRTETAARAVSVLLTAAAGLGQALLGNGPAALAWIAALLWIRLLFREQDRHRATRAAKGGA